jgi:hypothetical protein
MPSPAAAAPFIWSHGWGAKPSSPVGVYELNSGDDFSRFYRLLRRWRAETYFAPLMKDKIDNPNFQSIATEFGERAIPWIIEEIRQRPDPLVLALYFITKEYPVPAAAQGRITEIVDAWLTWYARAYPHDN